MPVKNGAPIDEKKQEQETPKSLLEELIREGARRLLQAAIEQEVTEYLERFREEKDDKGHRMVVRNGRLPERMFVTGVGRLRIHQPGIRSKREGETFTSAILPHYLRRVPTIATLLPVLHLKGISTGDMMPALEVLLGPHTPGLSATNIVRMKRIWETEYREWTNRDLSGKCYVHVWADGIHFRPKMVSLYRC